MVQWLRVETRDREIWVQRRRSIIEPLLNDAAKKLHQHLITSSLLNGTSKFYFTVILYGR